MRCQEKIHVLPLLTISAPVPLGSYQFSLTQDERLRIRSPKVTQQL